MYDNPFLIERDEREDGTVVEIFQEEYAEFADPRENDNLGTMVYFGHDFSWGDEQSGYDPEGRLRDSGTTAVALALRFEDRRYDSTVYVVDDLEDANGLIYADDRDLRAEYGDDPEAMEKARSLLEAEVEEYACYLRGEVYGWRTSHPEHDFVFECVGGYVGQLDYVKREAKLAGEYASKRVAQELSERSEWAARGVLTAA